MSCCLTGVPVDARVFRRYSAYGVYYRVDSFAYPIDSKEGCGDFTNEHEALPSFLEDLAFGSGIVCVRALGIGPITDTPFYWIAGKLDWMLVTVLLWLRYHSSVVRDLHCIWALFHLLRRRSF